jgi:class 3 adenylate cyclase
MVGVRPYVFFGYETMKVAPLPENEVARLEALYRYQILDTPPEKAFDELTQLIAYICRTPIALVGLIDANRQWLKSKIGLEVSETSREVAFCAHTILQRDVLIVPDTLADERFADNPFVTSDPNIRFYAGAPLITSEGFALGTLCAIDRVPRQLSLEQLEALKALSHQAAMQLELRRSLIELAAITADLQRVEAALRHQQEVSDRLLLNILPEPIAERMKQGEMTIADSFVEATVLFADIVDFTKLSVCIPPVELVSLLNQIFSAFDRLAEKHGLEKIKTIGDAYMVVGGLPLPRADHAEAVVEMALDMNREIARFTTKTGEAFSLRIGIDTGPVVAGAIGLKKFAYDLWGDTVNTASRIESLAMAGSIQVTATVYERLKDKYVFKERDAIEVKGKGKMKIYLLLGRKSASVVDR